MARYISSAGQNGRFGTLGAGSTIWLPGRLPLFGHGLFQPYTRSGVFTVPDDIYRLRVRVIGGGAGQEAAQSSSFGALLSATGGQPGAGTLGGAGGIGVGGDFRADGGAGGPGFRSGGGAAGSELGVGGRGGDGGPSATGSGGGGGGVGGHRGGSGVDNAAPRAGGGGGSPIEAGQDASLSETAGMTLGGADITGRFHGYHNAGAFALAHLLDGFVGGGGMGMTGGGSRAGGSGSGGGGCYSRATSGAQVPAGRGGFCGGGGGAGSNGGPAGVGGVCWPDTDGPPTTNTALSILYEARIGGGMGGTNARAGGGGGGYARGEFDVLPGQQFPVTVALQSSEETGVSGGLILVEY